MTTEHIHALYGPHVRAIPAWQVTLGTKLVQTIPAGWYDKPMSQRGPVDSSPVVSVGLNNGVVHLVTKNGLTWEHAEAAEVLVVE